jgi:CHAD domain-containing protein
MAKAWDVPGLGPDVPLARCARLILDTRFREMMSYREGTIAGVDIEQLHSMRVSSRRLRSAMRNFRNCFEPSPFRRHIERVREVADTLGAVRDLDVRIAWFEGVLASARRDERPGIRLLVANARAERDRARAPMLELLGRLERERYAREFLDFVWREEAPPGG